MFETYADYYRAPLERLIEEKRHTWKRMDELVQRADAENRDLTEREKVRYEELKDHLDLLTEAIERRSNPPVGEPISVQAQREATGWVRNRDEVPVLRSEERVFDRLPEEERVRPLSLRKYLRGIITGNWEHAEEERAMSGVLGSAGGYLVPTPLAAMVIDRMRNQTRVIQAGAQTVLMDSATLKMARVVKDAAPTWIGENTTVAEDQIELEQLEFVAQTLAVLVRVPRTLLEDAGSLLEETLLNSLAGALAVELDRVALYGSGVAPEPQGLMFTPGLTTLPMGENGAPLTNYGPLIEAVQKVWEANHTPNAYIMAPRTAATIAGFTATDGQPLQAPAVIANLSALMTNQVPTDRTQGTANNASDLIVGDFTKIMIGMRREIGIELLRERYADSLQVGFLAWLRADVQVAQVDAFAPVVGIVPA